MLLLRRLVMLGEKIAFYRKKNNLSQEELADTLGVTRQSISLWETEQSMPSMDNLLKLSKIFEISMDELCGKISIKKEENDYFAKAETIYDKDLLTKAFFHLSSKRIIFITIILVCCLFAFIYLCITVGFNNARTISSLILSVALGIVLFRTIYVIKRGIKESVVQNPSYKSTYYFYDNYIKVDSVMKNGSATRQYYYDEIKKTEITNGILYLRLSNLFIAIKVENLEPKEKVIEKLQLKNTITANNSKTIKVLLLVLFILSIGSMFIGITINALMMELSPYPLYAGSMMENIWVLLLFLPIPLTSLVMGIVFKNKNYHCIKNIVVGIIMAFFLTVFGLTSFLFRNESNHDYAYINRVESIVNIDFPDKGYTSIEDLNYNSIVISYTRFEEEDNNLFIMQIRENYKWKDSMSFIPADMIEPYIAIKISNCDYYCLYDFNDGIYNYVQSRSNHEYYLMGYDLEKELLIIIDFIY